MYQTAQNNSFDVHYLCYCIGRVGGAHHLLKIEKMSVLSQNFAYGPNDLFLYDDGINP